VSQSLIIALPTHLTLDSIAASLATSGLIFTRGATSIQLLRDATRYVDIGPMKEPAAAIDDYSSNEDLPEKFRAEVRKCSLRIVYFNDFHLAKATLETVLANLGDALARSWIDSDYGWVMAAEQFLARLQAGWDWRVRSPASS